MYRMWSNQSVTSVSAFFTCFSSPQSTDAAFMSHCVVLSCDRRNQGRDQPNSSKPLYCIDLYTSGQVMWKAGYKVRIITFVSYEQLSTSEVLLFSTESLWNNKLKKNCLQMYRLYKVHYITKKLLQQCFSKCPYSTINTSGYCLSQEIRFSSLACCSLRNNTQPPTQNMGTYGFTLCFRMFIKVTH